MSKLSIIIPVYNVEKYIKECLDSVKKQTFTNFEVLLIDDGSPDSSGAICDEYATTDSRFKVFHKENGGVASARNIGLDNAIGEWVTFLDPDDYLLSNDAYQDIFAQTRGEDFDLVYFGFNRGKGDVYPLNLNKGDLVVFDKSEILKSFFSFNTLWGGFFKRAKIENLRFTILKTGDDELYVQSYLLKKDISNVLVLGKAYIYFRINMSSITNTFQPTYFDDRVQALNILREIIKDEKLKIDEDVFQKKIIRYFFHGLIEYSKSKNVDELTKVIKDNAPKFDIQNIMTWGIVFHNKCPNVSYLLVKLKLYKQVAGYIKKRLNN